MTSIQPELWVETPGEAVTFYEAAFGATVFRRVGDGDDIVAQLVVSDAAFWVVATSATMKRLSPRAIGRRDQPGRCSSSKTRQRRPSNGYVAKADNRGWSPYGAPWLQPTCSGG